MVLLLIGDNDRCKTVFCVNLVYQFHILYRTQIKAAHFLYPSQQLLL
jgi:hypothetical protein